MYDCLCEVLSRHSLYYTISYGRGREGPYVVAAHFYPQNFGTLGPFSLNIAKLRKFKIYNEQETLKY